MRKYQDSSPNMKTSRCFPAVVLDKGIWLIAFHSPSGMRQLPLQAHALGILTPFGLLLLRDE